MTITNLLSACKELNVEEVRNILPPKSVENSFFIKFGTHPFIVEAVNSYYDKLRKSKKITQKTQEYKSRLCEIIHLLLQAGAKRPTKYEFGRSPEDSGIKIEQLYRIYQECGKNFDFTIWLDYFGLIKNYSKEKCIDKNEDIILRDDFNNISEYKNTDVFKSNPWYADIYLKYHNDKMLCYSGFELDYIFKHQNEDAKISGLPFVKEWLRR